LQLLIEEEELVSSLEIYASKAQLEEIRGKLHEIVQSVAAAGEDASDGEGDAGQARYRLTLAYYPLENKASPRRKR